VLKATDNLSDNNSKHVVECRLTSSTIGFFLCGFTEKLLWNNKGRKCSDLTCKLNTEKVNLFYHTNETKQTKTKQKPMSN